jgi:hypothetical protein
MAIPALSYALVATENEETKEKFRASGKCFLCIISTDTTFAITDYLLKMAQPIKAPLIALLLTGIDGCRSHLGNATEIRDGWLN